MSKQTVLAAALIGAGLGYDCHMSGLCSDSTSEADILLFSEAAWYAPYAAAMVDAAYGVTFTYPENWQFIYIDFGKLLEGWTPTDGNAGHELPEREEVLNELECSVFESFSTVATPTQQANLRTAIAQARQETA